MESLALDLRYAARALWKARGLSVVVVLTLTLGIGANTAIFSIVKAMLLDRLPYRDADRLVFVWADLTRSGYPRGPLNGPELGQLRQATHTFGDFAAIWSNSIALTGEGEPEQLRVGSVTTNFFQVLGADAALGRTFRPEDGAVGAPGTVLLAWDVFQRRFGGDPAMVGRQILVNDAPATLIGVMPPAFRLLLPMDSSVPDHLQGWVPFPNAVERGPQEARFLRVIGRMRWGVSIADARDDVASVARSMSHEHGAEHVFTVIPLQADSVREIRGPLLSLFGGVLILLIIACVNVASLLIARAASRARETAVRMALGASRGRLTRQALVEGLLLVTLGAAAGVLAGNATLRLLLALTPPSLSRLSSARIDPVALTFAFAISVVWGVLLSLAPLSELRKADVGRALLSQSRSSAAALRYRTRAGLVITQSALTVVLLASAGLLLRTFVHVLRVDPGFRADRHLTFRIAIPGQRYNSSEAVRLFADTLLERLRAIPGVSGVGAISHIPYDDLPNWGLPYSLTAPISPESPNADVRAISSGLFEALDVRLLEGRFFTADDQDRNRPTAIVDEKLAKLLWPGESAIGRQFFLRRGSPKVPVTVVGVVPHLKLRSLVDDLTPQVFVPWPAAGRNPMAYVVRATDPTGLAPAIRAAVHAADPRIPFYDLRPLDTYLEEARATRRFTMVMVVAFAVCALALTCLGVYGLVAFIAAHRRHEFGVRRALGAGANQVLLAVLREGLALTLAGCGCGLAVAVLVGRLLQSQLYAVRPDDPISYAAAVVLILAGSALGCFVPAWRAAHVTPLAALRD